ncbi:MAG: spore germination protein, partial [Carboxydocellales bacterium]
LVEEVRARINRIETDGIFGSAQLEEFIEDNSFAVFPLIHHTERPDKTSAHLLEGGIAIIVDGTPDSLLLPVTFWQFLHSPDDYYERVYTTLIIRGLRFIAMITALTLPSFYIAITTFHHEMIPTAILQTIITSRRGVPYPALVEALLMEFVLEVIREAGVRLPRNVGQAVSIVGALVLGQAAIQAKLAGPVMVVVVALTAIANFTIPAYRAALSIRYLRFGLMLFSGTLGMFGFVSGLFLLLVHLTSLRSFGTPFLAPLAPAIPSDFKDSQIRLPVWMMNRRPRSFGAKDPVRQQADLRPGPQQKHGEPKGGEKDA